MKRNIIDGIAVGAAELLLMAICVSFDLGSTLSGVLALIVAIITFFAINEGTTNN